MQKIIFLDIDGVLAIPNPNSSKWELSHEKQLLLGEILTKTGAKIVLSSSWRYSNLADTKKYMASKGFMFNDDLIGVTIRSSALLKKSHTLNIPRGVEIDHWIYKNIADKKDFTYVILDDDSDMLLSQLSYFINTRFQIGLTKILADKAIKILNRKNS